MADILASEYLPAYDKMTASLLKLNTIDFATEPLMTVDDIIDKRKKQMETSYYKYGSVYNNYIRDKLMKPLEDIEIRISKYEETHNVEFLLDALNFSMLAYWQKNKRAYDMKEADVFYSMIADDIFECKSCKRSVEEMLELYKTDSDLGYLVAIGVRLILEIQYPMYQDAHYKGTDIKVPIAGFCYNDIKNFDKM